MVNVFKGFFIFLLISFIFGCGQEKAKIVQISSIEGEVFFKASGTPNFVAATTNSFLFSGDAIRTGKDSTAILKNIAHSAQIKVFPETYYEIKGGNSLGFQDKGIAVFDVEKQQNEIVVETVHGITAVLGTQFGQVVSTDTFELIVEKGLVEFSTKSGEKRKIAAGNKIKYNVGQPLPEVAGSNLIESEALFGSDGFNFNRR